MEVKGKIGICICKFKFNILIYSQKSDLLTYFEKRRRVFHKGTVLSK